MGHALKKARPRVLFVDDEKRVLNSMRIMFRRDYDLFLASHGAAALKLVRDNDIDVIVADHRMPQMTGVEVLSRVRQISPRTVRILLTGYADLDAVEGSINEGEVFRFLTKPCSPPQLKETIALAARLAHETASVEAATARLGATDVDLMLGAGTDAARGPAPAAKAPARRGPPAAAGQARPPRPAPARPAARPGSAAAPPNDNAAGFDPTSTSVLEKPMVLTEGPRVAASARQAQSKGLGIIVFSEDPEVLLAVQQAVRGRIPVYAASNIVKVVKCLTEHQPGVLVTDVSDDKATIQAMTARLKQHLPQLVTIAVSQHRDALDMVWLINHGQIFRFLRKPLSPGRCAICLQAALKHHQMLLKNPDLMKRHEVDASGGSGVIDSMISKLKQVRRLWASA